MILPPDFHFLRPWWFWFLFPCALILAALWKYESRSKGLEGLCDAPLLPYLLLDGAGAGGRRWKLPALLFCWLLH